MIQQLINRVIYETIYFLIRITSILQLPSRLSTATVELEIETLDKQLEDLINQNILDNEF